MNKSILVIGAGFSGAVISRELAENGYLVDLIDQRDHIGGNAYDFINEVGIRIHKYGPHLFHTSNLKVVDWLSKFTKWIEYKHKVKALLADGKFVTLPVNQETAKIVGKDNIIDIFIRPYTKKMWGLELGQLDSDIFKRVPVRDDMNEFYFPDDIFQALPENGYTCLFENILDHPNIKINLKSPYVIGMEKGYFHTFNSMPIDLFFDFKIGELPYRSIRFHNFTLPVPSLLPVATVNFTHSAPYTRITEWKKFPDHDGNQSFTTLTVEEPCDYKENYMERYYPVKDIQGVNNARYKLYREMIPSEMTFIGRCGLYAYLDMHQAVSSALSVVNNFVYLNKK